MLKLSWVKLAAETRGIYKVKGVEGRMPERALWLEPAAATAFRVLETSVPGLVYSDIRRSAEASLIAMQAKSGVQPPGFSGHNFGLSFDLAIDDYVPPGAPPGTPKAQGSLTKTGMAYPVLLARLTAHGWFCHRRDGKRGFEDWHFNHLPGGSAGTLATSPKTWAGAVEARIQALYGPFTMTTRDVQAALAKLKLYGGEIDGIGGPLTRAAVQAFQRTWKLTETAPDVAGIGVRTLRTLAFVAAEEAILLA